MSMSPIGADSPLYAASLQQTQQTQAAQEARPERENDGDRDDSAAPAQAAGPTVNLEGQTIGSLLSVAA
ncbi:MAG TPA: hypothetical protein VN028_09355 [Rhodocyclaceae bacterium]|nr:hypothetical protein [Rhodocyclaceae bacterium]